MADTREEILRHACRDKMGGALAAMADILIGASLNLANSVTIYTTTQHLALVMLLAEKGLLTGCELQEAMGRAAEFVDRLLTEATAKETNSAARTN